jgi:hypothetical protein
MLKKAYEKVDALIMGTANKVVRAWNWTTGGTKSSLATLLNGLGAVAIPAGSYCVTHEGVFPAVVGAFTLSFTCCYNRANKTIEGEEIKAAEDGMKNAHAEIAKENFKVGGYILAPTSLATVELPSLAQAAHQRVSQGDTACADLIGLGAFCYASSFFVMNAENLPPRKNCLSRGIDSLKELLDKPTPALQRAQYNPNLFCRI